MKRTTHLLLTCTLLVVAAPVHAIVLPCVTGSPTRTPTRTPTATITPTFTLTPTHTPTGGAAPTVWAQAFGGTAGAASGSAVTTDASNNIYLAGVYATAADFGGGTLSCNHSFSNLVVARYSPTGAYHWSRCAGGGNSGGGVNAKGIAVDGSNNSYVTGWMYGSVDFGPAGIVSSPQGYGGFVAKLDSAGNFVWAKEFGTPTGFQNYNQGRGVAVDAGGNLLVAGKFFLSMNLGGVCPAQSASLSAGFVARLNATTGACQWVKSFGQASGGEAGAVAADRVNNTVMVTGSFSGSTSFGGPTLVSNGTADVFVAKYAADGTYQWAYPYGGTAVDVANGIAVDSAGRSTITGYFSSTADFGSGTLTNGSGGQPIIYIAAYDSSGTGTWSRAVGQAASENNTGNAVAVDSGNNVVVTGTFGGPADFGTGTLTPNNIDVFIAKYDSTGTPLAANKYGGNNIDSGVGIAVDGSNFIIADGYFTFSITFGSTTLTGGGADCYLAKLPPGL